MRPVLAAALALLLACALPARADVLTDITSAVTDTASSIGDAAGAAASGVGDVASNAGGAVVDAGKSAVDKAGDVAGDVGSAVKGAVISALDAIKDAANWVECKVIDITTFSLDPCLAVAPDAACDAACKAELDKLPAPCLDRIATSVYESNDTENIDKFEGQLIACNITFEIAPAPAPAPLPW